MEVEVLRRDLVVELLQLCIESFNALIEGGYWSRVFSRVVQPTAAAKTLPFEGAADLLVTLVEAVKRLHDLCYSTSGHLVGCKTSVSECWDT